MRAGGKPAQEPGRGSTGGISETEPPLLVEGLSAKASVVETPAETLPQLQGIGCPQSNLCGRMELADVNPLADIGQGERETGPQERGGWVRGSHRLWKW